MLAIAGVIPSVLFIIQCVVLMLFIFFYIIMLLVRKHISINQWFFPGKTSFSIGRLILSAIMGFGAAEFVIFCLALFPEEVQIDYNTVMGGLEKKSGIFLALYLLGYVVLGSVLEEIIFREILFTLIRYSWSGLLCNLIVSCLFAGMHGNIFQISYAFFTGILLGLIRENYGSLLYTVAFHIIFNFFGSGLFFSENAIYMMYLGSAVFVALIILFIVDLRRKQVRKE